MMSESGGAVDTRAKGNRDAQLMALAHTQRRRLLKYLLEQEPTSVTLSATVAHLATTTNRDYQQIETEVVHRDLPKLEDAGVVTYDPHKELLTYIGDKFVTAVLDLV